MPYVVDCYGVLRMARLIRVTLQVFSSDSDVSAGGLPAGLVLSGNVEIAMEKTGGKVQLLDFASSAEACRRG